MTSQLSSKGPVMLQALPTLYRQVRSGLWGPRSFEQRLCVLSFCSAIVDIGEGGPTKAKKQNEIAC